MQLGALHVPDDWELKDDFNSRVGTGKVSAYLRSLVEKDLSGTAQKPDATDENIISDLCERLRPERAPRLTANLARLLAAQPLILGKILEALDEDLEALTRSSRVLGPNPLVLMKVLPEDMHSVQAAYNFRQLPATSEELAQLFNPAHHRNLAIAAAMQAVKPKPQK